MMAKRILVPVDNEERAEAVVGLVADLARSSGATVRLLHVGPLPQTRLDAHGRVIAYQSQDLERMESVARARLTVFGHTQLDGVPVEVRVRCGDAVDEIVNEAEVFGADLIAVPAPRYRWWRPRRVGGLVARLLRRTDTPVMLFAGAVA